MIGDSNVTGNIINAMRGFVVREFEPRAAEGVQRTTSYKSGSALPVNKKKKQRN